MVNQPKQPAKEPEQIHKDQSLVHILLPILITAAICLAVFLFLIISSSGSSSTTEQWANISVMFLILPLALVALVGLLLIVLLCYLTGKWNRTLPPGLRNIRRKIVNMNFTIQSAAQKPAKPVIKARSIWAGIKALFIR